MLWGNLIGLFSLSCFDARDSLPSSLWSLTRLPSVAIAWHLPWPPAPLTCASRLALPCLGQVPPRWRCSYTAFTMESSLSVLPDLLIKLFLPSMTLGSGSVHYWKFHAIEFLKYLSSFRKELPKKPYRPTNNEKLKFPPPLFFCRLSFLCAFFSHPKCLSTWTVLTAGQTQLWGNGKRSILAFYTTS